MLRARPVLGASCFVALALSGCGSCGEGGGLQRIVPQLVVEPATLAFGDVPVGATKRMRITLRSVGAADLELESADVMVPFAVTMVSGSAAPMAQTIRTGLELSLDVAFSPVNTDPQSASLVIRSNDPEQPTIAIPVSGTGVVGVVAVRPNAIDLRDTSVGTSRTVELVFSNLGIEEVTGRLVTEGFARPEHVGITTFTRVDEPVPFGLAARSDAKLDLEYRPIASGADDGRLVFEICGERCGLEVDVRASAVEAVVRIEPPVVDFGTVGIGMTVSEAVLVQNTGTMPISVSSIAVQGGAELVAHASRGLPAIVEGNSSIAITLEYTPVSAATLQGQLVVRTTDAAVPEATVRVVGRGAGPLFLVQPGSLSFGVERRPGTYRRALLLLNAGSADVQVRALEVAGQGYALRAPPGLPVRLGSGQSLVVDVTFSPTEIREYLGTLTIRTDDAASPEVVVPLSGGLADRLCELDLSASRVNFGLMPVGFAREKRVTVMNAGTDPCVLTSAGFRAPIDPAIALDSVASPVFPRTLARGETIELVFTYTPTLPVESKGNFVLTTADVVFPERHVALLGSAAGYVDVFTVPSSLDFGSLRPGCAAAQREVRIFNAGTVDVSVARIDWVTAHSPELTLSAGALPATIAGGESRGFDVAFAPADLGVEASAVQVDITDLPYPIIVPVRAEGSDDPRTIDEFVQSDRQEVDVLFVIDDSCSMGDEQLELAQSFRNFIRQANLRDVEFHIGVTTTTLLPLPGAFVGPTLTPATQGLERQFQSQVAVGVLGSGIEQGLDAMASALSLATANIAPNQDFRRPSAMLVTIIVSDEDDQSAAAPVYFLNVLRNATTRSGYLTAVVTGQRGGCGTTMSGGGATPAPRYEEFVRLTGGLSESICGNWERTLANLGDAAFGLRQVFILSRDADVGEPIIVEIDGRPVPASDYTFDPANRAIRFMTAPPERSRISVEYTPTC
ncbi:choice-of-anchor D domain-containing protein [Myxococcota bacterium]|nr:choice-of-anchor D domain-containing protein [Myxococcota bacterium]